MKKIFKFFWVSLFSLLLAGCMQHQSSNFKMPAEEALQQAASGDYLLSPQAYAELVKTGGTGVTLVDLRSPALFDKAHLPDAINIPANQLLDDEQFGLLENSKTIVLFGEDVFQASGPWMLLMQLGLENVKILEVGYAGLDANAGAPPPETARYDFAAIFQTAIERHAKEVAEGSATPIVATRPAAAAKKAIVPVKKPKKKAADEEEGC